MPIHKIKYQGKTYVGRTNRSGETIFDPPLPPEYEERCKSNIKEAVEARQFPGLNTDTSFLANRGTLEAQFADKEALKQTVEGAQRAGYKPKPSDVYLSSLAQFPGDPQAWVGSDAKGHIRKVCEERGIGCSGSVNVPQPDRRVDAEEARKKARDKAVERKAKRILARQKHQVPKK